MPSKQVKKRIYNSCGLDRGTADRKIFDALTYIEDTFVVKFENEYSFIHDSIYETGAYHYGNEFPEHILEFMPSNFIANKVVVDGNPSFDDLNIKIKERHFSKLAERLYLDLESDKLFDVFMNKALKYQPFLYVFFQLMKKKSYEDFKITFFTPITRNCEHLIDYEDKAGRTFENMYRDETFRRELLTDKRVKVQQEQREQHYGIRGNDVTYTIRLISWVVYYGHTLLLQEIVNHVHDHNDSTDIVFGSNIEEQTRLLILSVYNGDPCMVELILMYMKKESIDATPMYMSDIDYLDENYHRTIEPLNAACHYGDLQIVKVLVQSDVNVNVCEYHEFPLSVATENGDYEMVKYLAENGANVNAFKPRVHITDGSAPPLYIASAYGYTAIANCLVQNGADENKDMFYERTPLFEASSRGFKDIVKLLVENGADVNFCEHEKKSPLFIASEAGHSEIVSYLVKWGCDINL
ncbi:ankyrin repeat and KH domain-containing protein mask-like [Mytilus trossulus]|uniref:ankyrin repeat and KH domain-containing protein mask-like n=1 Tax=Mytilus trossulus TaxID=6551 RepID=UPI003004C068